ncbi:uncharacterized protein KGF55_003167 [Candida pseudojiufengensis]|uniref:uncharacterized protein n=1 Tax=Candida pseudojiufengensis TaxID=497109 RepID=UPI00222589F9|nr:uncharacterized protein KGF55_003167 [Candida pseudojiufengensis]KAI5962091.1 hypothetical protein KGF55_003167 [Candida pseudojiufengensis]
MYNIYDRLETKDKEIFTILYIGQIPQWGLDTIAYGVEWDDPSKGKNNGELNNVKYFEPKVFNAGSFIKSTNSKISHGRKSFTEVIKDNYLSVEYEEQNLKIGTKEVEEVGLDKINFNTFESLTLDHDQIYKAGDDIDQFQETFEKMKYLDLSSNLFTDVHEVFKILNIFPNLEHLDLNHNRFNQGLNDSTKFNSIVSLKLGSTFLSIQQINRLILSFPSLQTLNLLGNCFRDEDITKLETQHLSLLDFSYNQLTSIPVLNLSALNLSHNQIAEVNPQSIILYNALDLRNNKLSSWEEIDNLSTTTPNLEELRINHNPVFDNMSIDDMTMELIGRFNGLTKLNGAVLSKNEIEDAELYFISKVQSNSIKIRNQKRWNQLLSKYNKIEEVHVSPSSKPWINLQIKYLNEDVSIFSSMFLKSTSIQRFKGLISKKLQDLSILQFKIFYYINEGTSYAKQFEIENYLGTLDDYSLHDNQNIYISLT